MKIPKARWYRIGLLLFIIYLVAFIDRSNIHTELYRLVPENPSL